jgi:predicted ABC-type ATPase
MEEQDNRPHVIVLAGPNGAGKSTAAPFVLRQTLGVVEFVNADVIAQGLSAYDPESQAVEAGRIMLRRLRALAAARHSFAFETTLSGRTFAPWLVGLVATGYSFELVYFYLPSADLAIDRVALRVRTGGHHVPAETIRRRFERGLRNFFTLYSRVASEWHLYNN